MSNLSQSLKWRELVGLWLRADGHSSVTHTRKPPPKLYAKFEAGETEPASHVQGLNDWALLARWEQTRDLATAMHDARRAADHDGKKFYAAAWMRHGSPVGEGYVVMPLEIFSQVLHELEKAR